MPVIQPFKRLILDRMDCALPSGWHGVRYVTRQYSGPFCKVVRTSDGALMDVYSKNLESIDLESVFQFARVNGVVGQVDLVQICDLTGNGNHINFAAGARPQLVRSGYVNTVADLPVYTASGSALGIASMPFVWTRPIMMNGVLIAGSAPATGAYLMGVDTQGSGYRDTQLFADKNMVLGMGEDMSTMTPDAAALTVDTANIVTGIRNPTGVGTRGYLKHNGMLVSTFTTESQSTSLNPDRLVVFGDPDAGGQGVPGNYMPLGWGFQELCIWNADTPPSAIALIALEQDQAAFYNIPLYGTLAWPIQSGRKTLASNGSTLKTNTGASITYK